MRDEIRARLEGLPFFEKLSDDERQTVAANCQLIGYDKDAVLHSQSGECLGMVVVISGRLRVSMQSREGKEVTLYFLEEGDVDVLSASCVINQLTFDTQMVADTAARVMILPASALSKIHETNIYLQNFVYEVSLNRFSDVMWTMQEILFLKVDQRIAGRLLDEYARTDSTTVRITQETLARDISSAREVVTRVLKNMEKEGLLSLGRGVIELADPEGLQGMME